MMRVKENLFIISGTFNPLHVGHLNYIQYLEQYHSEDSDIFFEMGEVHCDKVWLPSIEDRLAQFHRIERKCIVTPYSTFLEKIEFLRDKKSSWQTKVGLTFADSSPIWYRNIIFCMGEDTFERFLDIKHYFGSKYERQRCLNLFSGSGIKNGGVMVFPRNPTNMTVVGGYWMNKQKRSYGLTLFHPSENFVPIDISSSQIRNGGQNG